MHDQDKTKEQLINELTELRQKVATLEGIKNEYEKIKTMLKESENIYRSLFELTPDGVFVVDIETMALQYANPAICKLVGHSEKELKQMDISRFHPIDALNRIMSEMEAQKRGEKTLAKEIPFMKKDGTIFYADINAIKIFMDGRECLIGSFRDVTEKKETKEALEKSERLYRMLAENASDVIWTTDMDLRFTYISPSVIQFLGYSVEEAMAKRVQEILTPSSFLIAMEAFAEALAREKSGQRNLSIMSRTMEFELNCKDGSIVWAEVKMSFLRDNDGRPFGILGVSRDISQRKQAEEALRESEQKLRSVVENIGIGVALISPNMEIVRLNKQMKKWFPAIDETKKPICYRSFNDPPRESVCSYCPTSKTLKDGEVHEAITDTPSGDKVINYRVISSPIKDKNENVIAAIEMVEDITERRRMEEGLQKAHEKLEQRVEERTFELAKANEQLKQEIEERKRIEEALNISSEKIKLFAYSVSHDLKNPAITLYGLTKILHKHYQQVLNEKGNQYCDQILNASEQIAALVEKINVYIATKEAPLTIEGVQLKEIIQIVREEFSSQLNIRQIKWAEPEYLPEIIADRISLLRVLRNLIDNALKYGGDSLSEINIGYNESDQFHTLSVKDDGVGIKKEASKKIFGVFKRYETSKGIEGTGLGLAIVKEIAERHGGKVWIEPGLKKGITFYVSFYKSL